MGRNVNIIAGIFLLIISYSFFSSYGLPSQLSMSILGAYFVFNGIFGIFQYNYVLIKRSYLGSLGLATYIGLIMVYLYLFNPYFVKDPLFYFFAFGFVSFGIVALNMYQRVENYQKMVKPYENALKINPNDITALNNKGAVMAEFRAYPDAIECFDKVVEIEPNDAAAWHNKGYSLEKLVNQQAAIEYYDKALKVDPGFVNAKKSGKIILEN